METHPFSKTPGLTIRFLLYFASIAGIFRYCFFPWVEYCTLPFSFNVKPRAFFIFLNSFPNCPVFTVHFFKTHHFMTSFQPRPHMYYFPIMRAGLLVRAVVCQGSCVPFPKGEADQLVSFLWRTQLPSHLSILFNLSTRGDIIRKSSPSYRATVKHHPQEQGRWLSHWDSQFNGAGSSFCCIGLDSFYIFFM